MEFKFDLLEKENVGQISLNNAVRISDPCYDIDTWCAGTLENVLPGEYNCFMQRVDSGDWGIRIASIEVRHENYLDVEPTELQDIDVGVDSGQAGIYDLDYFIKAREDKNGADIWYERVCNKTFKYVKNPNYVSFEKSEFWKDEFERYLKWEETCGLDDIEQLNVIRKGLEKIPLTEKEKKYLEDKKMFNGLDSDYNKAFYNYYKKYKYNYETIGMFTADTMDNKCLVSSSGNGDGGYHCLVGRNNEGKIVSIKIDYYYNYEEDEYDEE